MGWDGIVPLYRSVWMSWNRMGWDGMGWDSPIVPFIVSLFLVQMERRFNHLAHMVLVWNNLRIHVG